MRRLRCRCLSCRAGIILSRHRYHYLPFVIAAFVVVVVIVKYYTYYADMYSKVGFGIYVKNRTQQSAHNLEACWVV